MSHSTHTHTHTTRASQRGKIKPTMITTHTFLSESIFKKWNTKEHRLGITTCYDYHWLHLTGREPEAQRLAFLIGGHWREVRIQIQVGLSPEPYGIWDVTTVFHPSFSTGIISALLEWTLWKNKPVWFKVPIRSSVMPAPALRYTIPGCVLITKKKKKVTTWNWSGSAIVSGMEMSYLDC